MHHLSYLNLIQELLAPKVGIARFLYILQSSYAEACINVKPIGNSNGLIHIHLFFRNFCNHKEFILGWFYHLSRLFILTTKGIKTKRKARKRIRRWWCSLSTTRIGYSIGYLYRDRFGFVLFSFNNNRGRSYGKFSFALRL